MSLGASLVRNMLGAHHSVAFGEVRHPTAACSLPKACDICLLDQSGHARGCVFCAMGETPSQELSAFWYGVPDAKAAQQEVLLRTKNKLRS